MGNVNMFTLTDEQVKKIIKWRETHECSLRTDEHGIPGESYAGAIGGATTYKFTPTGLGTFVNVECGCGAELDVSDVDEW